MLVCDLCGNSNIRQEATIMLNPNNPFDDVERPIAQYMGDFFWVDFYLCLSCNEECQPIELPVIKEKKWKNFGQQEDEL